MNYLGQLTKIQIKKLTITKNLSMINIGNDNRRNAVTT